jgi:hypothetical protein
VVWSEGRLVAPGLVGGATALRVSTGTLALDDIGESLTLVATDGTTVLDVTHRGNQGNQDAGLVRHTEYDGPFERHSRIPGSVDRWSLGTLVTGRGM